MKRVLTLIMVLAFLCAGTALFANGKQEAEPSGLAEMTGADATSFTKFAVEEGAKLVLSGWGDQTEQKIYIDAIARFKKIYPDVIVDYQPIPADFQTKLKAMMAGGTAPDVFYVDDQLMTAFGSTGQLLQLDSYMAEAGVARSHFIESLLTIFTLDGDTYGLPKDWGTLGLVYLPEAFAAAGIAEPTDDWDWNDLYNAAKIISEKTDYAGFGQNADWARFAPWAFANGGSYTNTAFTSATLNTSAVKKAAEFVLKMYNDGVLVTSADVGAGWCGEAIGKELVAMTYEGGWMVNYMRNDFPDVNWKAVQVVKALNGVRSNVIFTNALGVNAGTKYPRAAAAFTIFLTSRENQAAVAETGFAYPAHPDQLGLIQDPNDKAIAAGGLIGRVAYWGPNTGKINDEVSRALERIYLGAMTIDESFAEAERKANAILAGE
ncbi:MAG: sugar ABC transporter substrate-binding protein [Spirochaetales bacterium]|nr:sugar ABC transporter substrate-binding protein [Spirochaetales bacterium]